jgi:NADH-quinone oxidoreductase subunit E
MPFSDQVRARLDADAAQIIGQYPGPRSALLPLLHLVQAEEGYVSQDGIEYCARALGLTETDVTGVVTFYTMYKRRPVGEYHVGVCTNTICGVLGGNQILAELHEHLGVDDDETTPDGRVLRQHDAGRGPPARRRPARGEPGETDPRPGPPGHLA